MTKIAGRQKIRRLRLSFPLVLQNINFKAQGCCVSIFCREVGSGVGLALLISKDSFLDIHAKVKISIANMNFA